jgi:hypothetical protein
VSLSEKYFLENMTTTKKVPFRYTPEGGTVYVCQSPYVVTVNMAYRSIINRPMTLDIVGGNSSKLRITIHTFNAEGILEPYNLVGTTQLGFYLKSDPSVPDLKRPTPIPVMG